MVYTNVGRENDFFFNRIRTMDAMAIYSFHRLIMKKVEIHNIFLSKWGFLDFFTETFIE